MPPKSKATTNSAPAAMTTTTASKSKPTSKLTQHQNGTSTAAAQDESEFSSSGKPDKTAYDAEQERIKSEIDIAQRKLFAIKDKISNGSKNGSGQDRRTTLRAELDELRVHQSGNKSSRSKILEQIKSLQDNVQNKIKELNTAKAKTPFKTVAEIDTHIKNLDKQVESGNLKIAEEKRALLEISQCKRSRKTVESFKADQDAIEADRLTVENLRKQLDDPTTKAMSDRFDAIKAELDELKRQGDEAYAGRNKLFEEKDTLQNEVNKLYEEKRDSAKKYREAGDKYWAKVSEDRARRAEKLRAQRAEEENAKKLELAERLREEASVPAYQFQIEDCQTLIDYLSGKKDTTAKLNSATGSSTKTDLAGIAPLELRKVEVSADQGLIARKKKGEEDVNYFVSGKGKKGKKSGGQDSPQIEAPSTIGSTGSLNIPLPILSALLSMSITPPASQSDVSRVIADLTTKKTWYEANQERQTKENVKKAESQIQKLTNSKDAGLDATSELSAEPVPTPAATDLPQTAVSVAEVNHKLEGDEGETAA